MNVSWLIEEKVFDENVERLCTEIFAQGMEASVCSYSSNLQSFPHESCVVFYGSLGLSQKVRRTASWIPGVYCDLHKYECTAYYPAFGQNLLNSAYVMLPFGDLKRRRDWLSEILGKNLFIRPNSAFKIFGGKVLDEDVLKYNIEPEKLVVVAPEKKIDVEWRLVVVDGKVIAGSQYIKDDEIEHGPCPDRVMEWGQKVIGKFCPERAWCLDICESEDKFYVLEVNAFSTSGLYACDMKPIVRDVSRVALDEWQEINEI